MARPTMAFISNYYHLDYMFSKCGSVSMRVVRAIPLRKAFVHWTRFKKIHYPYANMKCVKPKRKMRRENH